MSPRPKSETTKSNQYRLRMTDQELQKLEYCCKETGQKKADIIRQGIELIYNKIKKHDL